MEAKLDNKYILKCPRCSHEVPGLFLLKNNIYTKDWVLIKSFVCVSCKNQIHWGERK